MNNTYCDKCEKGFKIELQSRFLDKDLEEFYFICPHCLHEYISFKENKEVKKIKKKINKEISKYNLACNNKDIVNANVRYNNVRKFRKQLQNEMNKIN
ncbi:MAG: hypothetical protein N4A54_13830 [Peptostreptococcaceae bacterium]|jgi:hypothetical protein|nr:hypothetical protein [Peptostreptococcaceae bacterium]